MHFFKMLIVAVMVTLGAGCATLQDIGVSVGGTFMTSGSCGYRGGSDFRGNSVGSDAWAATRFIYGDDSPITPVVIKVAIHADDRYWQANRLKNVDLPVVDPDILEARLYNMWVTHYRGCDVNFNVRRVDSENTYSARRVKLQVVTETFGIRAWPNGLNNSFYVYAKKENGEWSIQMPQFDRHW